MVTCIFFQKSCLKKRLHLYENQIKKLLSEKSPSNLTLKANNKSGDTSTFFALNKRKCNGHNWLSQGQIVPFSRKNDTATKYFIKKKPATTPLIENELNAIQNTNGSDACTFMDCMEECKVSIEEPSCQMDPIRDDVSKTSVASSVEDVDSVVSKNELQQSTLDKDMDTFSKVNENKIEFFRKLGTNLLTIAFIYIYIAICF